MSTSIASLLHIPHMKGPRAGDAAAGDAALDRSLPSNIERRSQPGPTGRALLAPAESGGWSRAVSREMISLRGADRILHAPLMLERGILGVLRSGRVTPFTGPITMRLIVLLTLENAVLMRAGQ